MGSTMSGILTGSTISVGEAAAIFYGSGEVEVVEGPRRVRTLGSVRRLAKVVASESEYLIVKSGDGSTELRAGPASAFCHPVNHISVTSHPAVTIGDNELIVVYCRDDSAQGGGVKRRLIRGPGLHIPSSVSEWIHEFSWTGPATNNDDINAPARKVPHAVKKSKLILIPGKMYFDVESVRTKDNAVITVKLMIFYRLSDVEVMLDSTNDPMADIINSISADIIEWCAPKDFAQFLQETDRLNTLQPYAQLQSTAKKIGYTIDKVVFRGYTAPASLQRMHDGAIEKRTALALATETEQQEQALADFKLKRETERAAQQQALELQRLEHELALMQKKTDAEQQQRKVEYIVELERLKAIKGLDREGETAMAQYLVAKDCQLPPVVQCGTMMSGSSSQQVVGPLLKPQPGCVG